MKSRYQCNWSSLLMVMLNYLAIDYVNATYLMHALHRVNKENIILMQITSSLFMGKYISNFIHTYIWEWNNRYYI